MGKGVTKHIFVSPTKQFFKTFLRLKVSYFVKQYTKIITDLVCLEKKKVNVKFILNFSWNSRAIFCTTLQCVTNVFIKLNIFINRFCKVSVKIEEFSEKQINSLNGQLWRQRW